MPRMTMETYFGCVRTPSDAIKLFEACRLGMLPRVQRRLSEKERQAIRSGSVFVWDEREAGMRRWTDGKSWSASRVSGSFLTYREMEGKRSTGFQGVRKPVTGKTPDSSGRGSDEDGDMETEVDGYRYKADGLMKQSFSITTSNGQHLHLISYFARQHPGQPELPQPSSDPQLRHISPTKGMYPETTPQDGPTMLAPLTRGQLANKPPFGSASQHPAHTLPPAGGPQQQQYSNYWPPSPISTPPYSHYTASAGYPQQPQSQSQLPPPTAGHHYAAASNAAGAGPQQQQAAYPGAPSYDRAPLPPPTATSQLARTSPGLGHYSSGNNAGSQQTPGRLSNSPRATQAQNGESPRSQHVHQGFGQQTGLIDPTLAALNSRNPQGMLPALSSAPPTNTPPQRALSVSPPRSSHSDLNALASSNKASLSALLHPTPASSEPNSANPGNNSAGSSPRQMGGLAANGTSMIHPPPRGEDARALSVLDSKFRI